MQIGMLSTGTVSKKKCDIYRGRVTASARKIGTSMNA